MVRMLCKLRDLLTPTVPTSKTSSQASLFRVYRMAKTTTFNLLLVTSHNLHKIRQ